MAKKADVEVAKAAKAQEDAERQEASDWSVGAKNNAKAAEAEAERDRKLRLKAENAALIANEEASLAGVVKKKSVKKKGKDDFDLLNAALAAAPKTKSQKEAEAKKKVDDEKKKKEAQASEAKALRLKEHETYVKEQAMRGIIVDHADELLLHSRDVNQLDDENAIAASGIDGAIDALAVSDGAADAHPERRRKALYNAYLEQMLPMMRVEHPGLRLQQYKERIFEMWQSALENPVNSTAS